MAGNGPVAGVMVAAAMMVTMAVPEMLVVLVVLVAVVVLMTVEVAAVVVVVVALALELIHHALRLLPVLPAVGVLPLRLRRHRGLVTVHWAW